MTKPITFTSPSTNYSNRELEAGLKKITRIRHRLQQARILFNTQVNEQGVSPQTAIEHAFYKAAAGTRNEAFKREQALEAAQINLRQRTGARDSDNARATPSDELEWGEYPPARLSPRGVIGAVIGSIITMIIVVLMSPWLLFFLTKSPNPGVTTTCILLFALFFLLFGGLLGWSIGVGRFTINNETTSSETSTTSTTKTA